MASPSVIRFGGSSTVLATPLLHQYANISWTFLRVWTATVFIMILLSQIRLMRGEYTLKRERARGVREADSDVGMRIARIPKHAS